MSRLPAFRSMSSRLSLLLLGALVAFLAAPVAADGPFSGSGAPEGGSVIGIGLAKDASNIGRQVTFDVYVENFAASTLTDITVTDDLDATFGAGNYTLLGVPELREAPGTFSVNASFDGSSDTELVAMGSSLASGEMAVIRFLVEITTVTDQGFGLGVYQNQASGDGLVIAMGSSDLSDDGTDPDPNGNGDPSEAGEDDPTVIDLLANPIPGVAKTATVNGMVVTFDLYLETFGNRNLTMALRDDLDATLGAGNYTVTGAPAFVDDPGTLTLNAGFDGSSDIELISSGTLAIGDTAQIQFVVTVDTVVDLGLGEGTYTNQATAIGTTTDGTTGSDVSDSGINPDPNGNNNPNEEGENDATLFVIGEMPVIGLAKQATVVNSTVTLDFYLENLGDVDLSNVSVVDDLNAVFGAANFTVAAPTLVDDPGTLTLNPNFDGDEDTALLLAPSTLVLGDTAQIQVVVTVTRLTDVGSGLGIYSNQATASANGSGGGATQDLSDGGTDPDPNGNGDPAESGEDDPTAITVGEFPVLGLAKEVIVGGQVTRTLDIDGVPTSNVTGTLVEVRLNLLNLGNVTVDNIQITDDLDAVFGDNNYGVAFDFNQPTVFLNGPGTISPNDNPLALGYNGSTVTDVLNPFETNLLEPGSQATITFEVVISSIVDQGLGLGVYENQATATGDSLVGDVPTMDLSGPGNQVDPDSDGDPSNGTEDDPTQFILNAFIGAAKDVAVAGQFVTFDFYLETFGALTFSNLSLADNLDTVFGVGNYIISSPPSLVDDPGTLVLNPGFDGSSDQEILDPSSTMNSPDTAQIQFIVQVLTLENNGGGLGATSNQVTIVAELPNGQSTFDVSTAGTDPDPGGDDNPGTFGGENTPTTFTVPFGAMVGAGKQAMSTGNVVTLDLFLEGFGTGTVTNLSLIDDLDAVFGAGNYTITTPPAFVVDPGTLVLNGGYDGSADTDILTTGSTLDGGVTAQIQMVVTVDTLADLGNGLGFYFNQATVTGTSPNGIVLSDLSDDNTDPDANGNTDPSDNGAPTPILLTNATIGLALHSFVSGSEITFDYYIDNLSDIEISNILLRLPLNPIIGSGNYSVTQQPTRLEGPESFTPSTQYFGFSVFDILGLGSLGPRESARVRFVVNVTNTVNSPYDVSITVNATEPLGVPISDVSDDGIFTDPNGNGDPTEAGEDDPTHVVMGEESTLGVAKDMSSLQDVVTVDLYLENLGNVTLSNISVIEDLDAAFGAGNYTLTTPPSFIDDPGTLTLNGSWNGSGTTEMMTLVSSTLAAADTAQIQFQVTITDPVPDIGLGDGVFENQVVGSATGPSSTISQDLSDSGTDPDSNGSGNPADVDEGDVTSVTVVIDTTAVGVAKNATVNGDLVTLDFTLENLGNVTLSNFSLTDDLDAVFGAGNYTVVQGPVLTSPPRSLELNDSFNGSSDTQLIESGTQFGGLVETFQVIVRVTAVSDQGLGFGMYSNQVTVTAEGPDTTMASDVSDSGTDPDPNGNGFPDDTGEDDPTLFTLLPNPIVGVAKTASVTARTVTFDLFLEALGNADALTLSLTDNLDAVFGAGNYSVTGPPSLIIDPGTLTLNGAYDGSGNDDLLVSGSSTLAQGVTAQIRFTVGVTTVTDQGLGFGMFANQATSNATATGGGNASDLSDSGTEPDANGDGNPNEVGENDVTTFMLAGSIGDFVWNDLDGDGVQDGGESGLSGVTVFLDTNANGDLDMGEPSQATNGSGAYLFDDVAAGSYTVAVDETTLPTGFALTTGNEPLAVILQAGEQLDTADFGYQAQASLALTKIDSVDPVTAGQNTTYTLEVTNNGPADTTGVQVLDLLPPGVSVDSNTGGCLEDPADITGLRALLSPSEIVPPVTSTAAGSATFWLDTATSIVRYAVHVEDIDNILVAEIRAGGPGVNGLTEYFLYNNGATPFDPSNPITGTLQLTALEVTEFLNDPLYVNIRTSDFPSGEMRGQINVVTDTVLSCDLGDLANGDSTSFDIDVTVAADVPDGTVLANVAAASSDAADPNAETTPNGVITGTTVLETTTVETLADVTVTKTDSADPVNAGTGYSYTVEVSNAGPSDAQNVVVTDTLPMGVTFVSTSGCAEDPNGVPTCTLGTVAAGGSASYTVNVTADAGTLGTVTNTVSVTTDTAESDSGNNDASEDTEIIAVADLSITLMDSPDPVTAGNGLTYTAEVTNNGPSVASGNSVAVTLPAGVTLVSTTGCTEDPVGVPTCSLADLNPGGSAMFTIDVTVDSGTTGSIDATVTASTSVTDNNAANDSATETTTVETSADLSITKIDDVDPVTAGNNLIYTLEVSNAGPSDAVNVVITETLPAEVTLASTSGCDEDPTGVPTCSIGDLAAGDSAQVTVEVTVDADAVGPLSNNVSVASDTNEVNGGDNVASEDTAVIAEADLSIAITDSPDPVAAGTALTYTVEVTNNGPSMASAIEVAVTLPPEVTFSSTSGCTEDPTGVPTCSLGDLAPSATASFTITVDVQDDVTGTITASATVSSSTTDSNGANDSASEDTEVIATSDLAITKTDSADPVVAGTNLTYTIEVTNNGPSVATGVTVTDTLDAGTFLVSTTGCSEDPNGVPTCTLGTLAVGNSASFTVEVTVLDAVLGTITNTATVAADGTDPNPADNTATEDTEVTAESDLSITISDDPDPVAAGGTLTYDVVVSGSGPSQVSGVEVTVTLAPELTLVSTTGCDNDPNGVPTCMLPDVASDAPVGFQIETQVDAAASAGTITTSVEVTTAANDPNAANNTASEDTLVDDMPPTVTNLDSQADTGDGMIEECEEVRVGVNQLLLTFSEPLFDPEGDTDPDDVTNPANYLLVAAGPDRDLSTEVCGAPQGDDVAITIDSVTFDEGTLTAALSLPGIQTLEDEVYRLLACGSTTLQDIAGIPLDGNADGIAGDDFLRSFRVERTNLLENGYFDCDIASWVPVSTVPEEIAYSTEDSDEALISGSAAYTNLSASQDFSLGQCVPVAGNRSCNWQLRFRLDLAPEVLLSATRTCEFFSAAECGGSSLGSSSNSSFLGDTGGVWLNQELLAASPVGAASMLCSLDLRTEDGDDFDAFLDNAFLTCDEDFLFIDGFESGDTSAWSNAIP